MDILPLNRAFTLIEPGPVTLVTTNDGHKDNVMTISWTMVLDFSAVFAFMSGPWNYSYRTLRSTGECVIAIPTADMIDTVIGIGTCTGEQTDKFAKFSLAREKASDVRPPLLADCLGNIECRLVEVIERPGYNIVTLKAVAAWCNTHRAEKRLLHAIGDGTFVADGERFDRREAMRTKVPEGS